MNIEQIRKLAAVERGRRLFEPVPVELDPVAITLMQKAAQVADPGLLFVASQFEGDTLETYERLGGTYKQADKE
jgi:hypothetical protein